MAITINKNVNLEASFEKFKKRVKQIEEGWGGPDIAFRYGTLLGAIDNFFNECTTSDDVPSDLFTQLGNYFEPE